MKDPAPPIFVARANVLEHEAIWRLTPDALELQGGPTAGPDVVMRFPYRDIVRVRLSYAPSRVDSARYRCDLTMRSGGKIAILLLTVSATALSTSATAADIPARMPVK